MREAHDIIDELRMMRRIYEQQLSVVKDFSKHLHGIHEDEYPVCIFCDANEFKWLASAVWLRQY
jgi:hypothetical protein